MSLYLAEVIPNQIVGYIQSNINSALSAEIAVIIDGIVPLVEPEQYYDYEEANPPQCPALYVLLDRIDYRLGEAGANFICGVAHIRCGMILEDFRAKELTHAARRYANVLHKILNNTQIDYTNVNSQLTARDVVKISGTTFSDTFKKNAQANSENSAYRKEFVHDLEVEHYENFS